MIHYHGTPISPISAIQQLAGRHFCVSFAAPQDIVRAHQMGQSVMLDNGAFKAWRTKERIDWRDYYDWCVEWLAYPTTWAVIPDEIDGGEERQNKLVAQWPFRHRGAPVWHMDEPIYRLLHLCQTWPRVCIGSTKLYRTVMSEPWQRRMDLAFNAIVGHFGMLPWIHMLRGMQCAGERWPFASVDSTDIARNHNRMQNTPRKMADRWDAIQCPGRWIARHEQMEMVL